MSKPSRPQGGDEDLLAAVPLFADLSPRERERLRSFMTQARVAAGKVLTAAGVARPRVLHHRGRHRVGLA